MSDLLIRLKTASLLLIVMVLSLLYLPNSILLLASLLLFSYASYELLKVYNVRHKKLLFILNFALMICWPFYSLFITLAVLMVMVSIFCMLFYQSQNKNLLTTNISLGLSLVLLDAALFALVNLSSKYGLSFVVIIWLAVAVVDAGGYFFGRAFGRHKFMPNISPKKTWEGLLGAAVVLGLISIATPQLSLALAMLILIMSVFGDLWFSFVKRSLKIKDYSNILPGHGGVVDRIDGLIFVLPVAAFACEMFAKIILVS